MPRSKSGGRLKTSITQPRLFAQRDSTETEVKYFGLVRDEALGDLESADKALAEVLKDIQDPAEASSVGIFKPADLQILDGISRYDLKKEDLEILRGASINAEDSSGVSSPLVNPRQRISDRIAQAEGFAGRGTSSQGQGAVLYKYYVPETEPVGNAIKYSHTSPPPFFTEEITSVAENSADFIPTTSTQIENTHRIGYIQNGEFVPESEEEYWWSGEYDHYMAGREEYGNPTQSALTNPKFPIVRDGNMKFDQILPTGINTRYNWGLRFDMWFRRSTFSATSTMMRWVAQVNGHLRIDYYDKSGYNSVTGAVQGTWRTALNTANSTTYYSQISKESPVPSDLGSRLYYLQGGPTMPLGTGTGTLPAQRSLATGGALDLAAAYSDIEGNLINEFKDDYVPVVIRFWYGQPSTNPTEASSIFKQPLGPASFFIQMLETNLSTADLSKWNDYSSQLRLEWDVAQSAWKVDTTAGGSAVGEANFANYAQNFEIIGYTSIAAAKPTNLAGYVSAVVPVVSGTTVVGGVTYATFTVSGIVPSSGSKIWVVARNRPYNILPGSSFSRGEESMWERYVFNPNTYGKYRGAVDLLEKQGRNYAEPNPAKVSFEENLGLYKATYGRLPTLSTYTSERYDGTLTNTVTTSNTQRDYDYNHPKLLMIGRQKKGTVAEIGTTAPYAGKALQAGEVRKKGENYTFVEVVENAAGFGGNVIINAYPSNDLGVISTASATTYGKALHMVDNTTTFSKSTRQNISTIVTQLLPSTYSATIGLQYVEEGGVGRLYYVNGSTKDTTGIIASLLMGATSTRNHATKSAFIHSFKNSASNDFSFYGLIGISRPSEPSTSITLASSTTFTAPSATFQVFGAATDQYNGTVIKFSGDATEYKVTSFNSVNGTVTFTPAKTFPGTYTAEIFYNYFQLGAALPGLVVDSTGSQVSRSTAFTSPSQIKFVFSSAYQFLRADNGSGLSFGETLYANAATSPTQIVPFSADTELPAPPADIVTPFGYDNSTGASDPGLGGLCYPPYSAQNIDLQTIVKSDSALYGETAGNFDVWWGGRIGGQTDMGQKYLYVTNKLMFDFAASERSNLLSQLSNAQKPTFTASTYTHKLEVELNVALPSATVTNLNIYNDVRIHSNNKPVKDKYYLFVAKQSGGSELSVLSVNSPSWT